MSEQKQFKKIPSQHREAETERIQFSFRYLDSEHHDFPICACSAEYLQCLLRRIKDYEEYTVDQFRDINHQNDRTLYYFPDSEYPNGFSSLSDEPPSDEVDSEHGWEIKLAPNAKPHLTEAAWRVHGMLLFNMFYVVWLDPCHKVFPNHHPAHVTNRQKQKRKL